MSILWQLATSWWSGRPKVRQTALEHLDAHRFAEAVFACRQMRAATADDNDVQQILASAGDAATDAVAHFQAAADTDSIAALRHVRREFVALLRSLPTDALASWWRPHLEKPWTAIRNSGLREQGRDAVDESVFVDLRAESESAQGDDRHPWRLAAGMMLGHNFEQLVVADPTNVPEWLREAYCEFLLEMPKVHNRVGDATTYADYLARVVDRFHRTGINARGINQDPIARQITSIFALRANFIQAYFSTNNLRDIYRKRGDLIAAALVASGSTTLAAFPPRNDTRDKIRLGILAQHFSPQTETYFTLAHFDHIDRSRFDITLYTLALTGHDLERRCIERADRIEVLPPDDLAAQVRRIRDTHLDILLIGTNMTAVSNPATFLGAHRLAPIQIASVSSPVTTGLRHMDIMLTAQWNEPQADAAEHYTERLWLLPGSINYYAFQYDTDPATVSFTRSALSIADATTVFFSGANYFKVIPELSRSWARILAAVPDSVLLLMPFNANWSSRYQKAPFIDRIRNQMRELGVDPARLRVLDPVPTRADVHRMLAVADVYLDAYPFAGACSMLDPIIVGVPPVVRSGPVGRSNHGASLMRMIGLEDLVCDSEEQYVAGGIALATDSARRARTRATFDRLAQAQPPPYFDTTAFSARVGDALVRIHEEYLGHVSARAAMGADALRAELQALADAVVGRNFELDALTDIGMVQVLIAPFFRAQQGDRSRHMVDVGACYGGMAVPFLADGWTADLFEPDPESRLVAERAVEPFGPRCRVFAAAVTSAAAPHVAFHKSRTPGLSGLETSPFGDTEMIIEVPCVRLADFYAEQSVVIVDFLKIDAEGYDFDVLDSHDFASSQPRLVMVEYGTHFLRQSLDVINEAIAGMAAAGYGSISFNYDDDGNFSKGEWTYRLTEIFVDRQVPDRGRPVFGNILFYRRDDTDFLWTLHSLLDTCRPRPA